MGKLDCDLAEMTGLLHGSQRVRHFCEAEGSVDHGFDVVVPDGRNHVLEHSPAADGQTDHVQVFPEQTRNRDLLGKTSQHSDHKDSAADADGLDRLLDGILASYFDDVINAAARPVCRSLAPLCD